GADGRDPNRPGDVKLWDAATGREVRSFAGHAGVARCVAFAPDDKVVAAGCTDRVIHAWDVATGKEVRRFEGNENADGMSLACAPDGRLLLSGRDDGFLRLRDG